VCLFAPCEPQQDDIDLIPLLKCYLLYQTIKSKAKPHYLLFAAVLSGPKHFDDRQFLRNQSWLTMLPGELKGSIKYQFILGQLKPAPVRQPFSMRDWNSNSGFERLRLMPIAEGES
jgi:hypothetical protein